MDENARPLPTAQESARAAEWTGLQGQQARLFKWNDSQLALQWPFNEKAAEKRTRSNPISHCIL